MNDRDVLDLLLAGVLSVVVYVETFGLADPITAMDDILHSLSTIDIRVFLVIGGVFGVGFLAYLAFYLPRKNADRSMRGSHR